MVKSWFHGQSGRLLVIFDRAEHRPSISTISFLAHRGCHYHDPELASAGDGGGGGGGGGGREHAHRLDFQTSPFFFLHPWYLR
jgi:hypothetical protein